MMMRLVKLSVSVALIVLALYFTESAGVLQHLRGADIGWLCLSAACLTVVTVLMAMRWKLVAKRLGLHLQLRLAIREYYYSNLLNQIIPGGVVGDISRAVRQKDRSSLKQAALSVIIERLVGQCVLLAILALGLVVTLLLPGGIVWPVATPWLLGLGIVAAVLALIGLSKSHGVGFLRSLAETLGDPVQLLLSTLISVGLITGFYACARATGAFLPLEAFFTTVPLVLTAMIVPLSIGGWGWREGAAAILFPLAGASASAGIATGIAYGAILLITALPALAFLLTTSSFVSSVRALAKQ